MNSKADSYERLPLEYPWKEALKIYGKRLAIFIVIVLVNFILLGTFLLTRQISTTFAVLASLFIALIAILIFIKRDELTKHFQNLKLNLREAIPKIGMVRQAFSNCYDLIVIRPANAILSYCSPIVIRQIVAILDRTGLIVFILTKRAGSSIMVLTATLDIISVLANTILERAYLAGVNLTEATLEGADLVRANLTEVILERANLASANLTGAILEGANLVQANLTEAILEGTELVRANLKEAILERADLMGADLTEADLTGADLTGAKYDQSTIWPKGFSPERAGAKLIQ